MRKLNLTPEEWKERRTLQRERSRKPNTICDFCGRPIYRRPFTLALNAGKFCSRSCRNKTHKNTGERGPNPKLSGPNNPAWKGGVTWKRPKGNYKGVKYVRCPMDFLPMARKDGYVMEHRLVMAQSLGRCLLRTEVVHHIDHNPAHNWRENLLLFSSNGEHKKNEVGMWLLNQPTSQYASPESL